MEAILLGGWLHYITQMDHGSGFPAHTPCEVRFGRKGTAYGSTYAIVRRTLKDWEIKAGKKEDINHPGRLLYFPHTNYWYWPGIEDEATARKNRECIIYNARNPGALSKLRKLKPY